MGKPTSCLRIISCAGGSTDLAEAGAVDQTKGSKVSKGWSFKNRSSSGRAVSNSLSVETPSAGIKESLESAAINFETPSESTVLEKKSAIQLDEKKPEPFAVDLTDPVTVSAAEKQPYIEATHVTDNVIVSNNEKQSTTSSSDVTDRVTVSKTEEDNAVFLVDESVVIIIQSAIRAFLAQKDQIKRKSAVKLQAAVRGHLVRCHAIGALRCIQAIVKMQLLIRDRYVRLPLEEQAIESDKKGDHTRKVRKPAKVKPDVTYTSMNDLLKSSFARQLLESSPKSNKIKIKCDPLRRDSSWAWLERWMSLASPVTVDENAGGIKNGHKENVIEKEQEQEEKISVEDYLFHEENEIFSEADHVNSNISTEHSKLTAVEEVNPISSEIANSYHNFSVSSLERRKTDTMRKLDTSESAAKMDLISFPLNASMNSPKITSVNENPAELKIERAIELNTDQGTEQEIKLRPEEYDIVTGSGTESCPSVIAVESIIEHELVSVPIMPISSDSATQDTGVESVPISANIYDDAVPQKTAVEELGSANAVPQQFVVEESLSVPNSVHMIDSMALNTEAGETINHSAGFDLNIGTATSSGGDTAINLKEPSQSDPSSIQGGGPECSTEISVTSTVDSPDSLVIRLVGVEPERTDARDTESHIPEESNSNIVKVETESNSSTEDTKQSNAVSGESAENATVVDTDNEEKDIKTDASNLPVQLEAGEKKELEASISDLTSELEGESESQRSHQASPGASPRSTVTITESQGTPSSQVSVPTEPKSAKTEKSGSIKKHTILSTAKKSPSHSSSNSGGTNSSEQLHKDQKSLKRRTSFGSPKPDIADAEQQKESSSSSSLPSYMQATESAKAKANAGHSRRSSPDVADKDVFIRKRQSLSGAKDRQESPRVQRASSQAQSGSKSSGTSPSEKKWHR